jgi:hypothetical protein
LLSIEAPLAAVSTYSVRFSITHTSYCRCPKIYNIQAVHLDSSRTASSHESSRRQLFAASRLSLSPLPAGTRSVTRLFARRSRRPPRDLPFSHPHRHRRSPLFFLVFFFPSYVSLSRLGCKETNFDLAAHLVDAHSLPTELPLAHQLAHSR